MNRTEKCAVLFSKICKGYVGADDLGKKAAQKLFYFFEREGINLGLRYGIHFYGPYSSKLDDIMGILESDGVIKIDTSGMTHVISLRNNSISSGDMTKEELAMADEVMDSFKDKSPRELEELSTLDYVANRLLNGVKTKEDIINKFVEIKGEKFSEESIETSLQQLEDLKLVCC